MGTRRSVIMLLAALAFPALGLTGGPAGAQGADSAKEPRPLHLDRASTEPGGTVVASGDGCDSRRVEVALDAGLGTTVDASAAGSFSAEVVVPLDAAIGRHTVTARCGGASLRAPLDVAVVESNSTPPAALLVTLGLFFVALLEGADLRASSGGRRRDDEGG